MRRALIVAGWLVIMSPVWLVGYLYLLGLSRAGW